MPVLSPFPTRNDTVHRTPGGGARPITIGLVNNMPDKALRSTERQYRELLALAAMVTGDLPVALRIFSFPGLPRSEAGQQHVHEHHEPIEALWNADIDGLIVTGTEPRAASIADEPYWPTLTELVDWAAENTFAAAWSCLAAHAAVRYLDGVERQPLPGGKLSGVFDCTKTAEHVLVGRDALKWTTPHSRCNDLRENDLWSAGYHILARSPTAGVDLFAKRRGRSLFMLLQGHPEYDGGALFREYRRDVGRFLAGEQADYPDMPEGYFDNGAADAMLGFRMLALRERHPDLLACFPHARVEHAPCPWQDAAARLYGNWLSFIADEKARRLASRPVRAATTAAAAAAATAPAVTVRPAVAA